MLECCRGFCVKENVKPNLIFDGLKKLFNFDFSQKVVVVP